MDAGAQQKAAVARAFGATAADYDQSGVEFFGLFAQRLVEHLRPRPGWHVVDVGAGRGAVVFPLADAVGDGGSVTALDLAEPMVTALAQEVAARNLRSVTVRVGDAEHLAVADGVADAVTASMVLFFLPDVGRGLREFHRVLRPGGLLACTVFGEPDPRWAEVYNAFNLFLPPGQRLDDSRPRHPALDAGAIVDTVRAAGFAQVECIDEVHPIHFADVEQWHTWSWSVGLRGTWLQIPQNLRPQARDAVLAAVRAQAAPDGSITEQFAVRTVLARRGQ